MVLLFFLRSISSILVIGLSIPVSVISTFIILYALGRSLNMIMLAGLAFAVGNVVDNSIVVLENIFRHREMGKSRVQAALDGASEVWGAILASTLTNLAVFLPIILLKDEVGQLFRTSPSPHLFPRSYPWLCPHDRADDGFRAVERCTGVDRYTRLQRLLDIMLLGWLGRAFSNGLVRSLSWLHRGVRRRLAVVARHDGRFSRPGVYSDATHRLPTEGQPQPHLVHCANFPQGLTWTRSKASSTELERRYMQMPEIERIFAVVARENPSWA